MSNLIDVSIRFFPQLFEKKRKIIIPDYQRPYVWGKEKTEDLLKDLEEHFLLKCLDKPYYLGTILYYYNKKESVFEIIDGQQRITTLLILQNLLSKGPLPDHQNVEYNSHQSIKYIQEAQTYFSHNIELLQKLHTLDFLGKLNFTLIITHTEDDAFTFFDTQNNRGMRLGSTDYLKAYHLRAIESIHLQEQNARIWEMNSGKNGEGPFLSHLFEKILWRSRNWKGQNLITFESKDAILKTFQKNSLKWEQKDGYPLYPNFYNRLSIAHSFGEDGDYVSIQTSSKPDVAWQYPFSLRQPLHKGLNFFKYTEKYAAIHELLFGEGDSIEAEIQGLRKFYKEVYNDDMSAYLRHFMQLCLVAYYDVFGKEKILQAAYCFDYLIGSLRLEKQQIKKEAIRICLKKNQNNLLDVISHSYLPQEIFDFVYSLEEVEKIYFERDVKINDGVQGRYKARVLGYFGKTEKKLTNRKVWSKI